MQGASAAAEAFAFLLSCFQVDGRFKQSSFAFLPRTVSGCSLDIPI